MSHFGISIWRGKFNKTSGKIMLDRTARSGTAKVQVDTARIDWGHHKKNQHAIGPARLNVAKPPVMTCIGAARPCGA